MITQYLSIFFNVKEIEELMQLLTANETGNELISQGNQKKINVLMIDDDEDDLIIFKKKIDLIGNSNIEIIDVQYLKEGIEICNKEAIDLVLLDLNLIFTKGIDTLIEFKEHVKNMPIIVLTGLGDFEIATACIREGAIDFLVKGVTLNGDQIQRAIKYSIERYRLLRFLRKALSKLKESLKERDEALAEIKALTVQLEAENVYLQEEIKNNNNFDFIITKNPNFIQTLNLIEQVAPTDSTVLILGETGTGKELLARAVHSRSNRSNKPLVKINCASLPANLIESELFGHEKGAFTGAIKKRIGFFELAHKGSLFLDEIGEMPIELQAKLLRVLQDGKFERIGGEEVISTDVRVIAATNRNLEKSIEEGKFRSDLYYRLNVFQLESPPLRDRKEDIKLLLDFFVKKFSDKMGKSIKNILPKTLSLLESYHWPGNIRELENVIERAVILSDGKTLNHNAFNLTLAKKTSKTTDDILSFEEMQKAHILKALKKTQGRVSGPNGAALLLQMNPKTLDTKMRKLGIKREEYLL